jgi:hypothetical protein
MGPRDPGPGTGAHLVEGFLGLEAERVGGLFGAGHVDRYVTGAAVHDVIGQIAVRGAFVGGDDLQHGIAAPGAEVDEVALAGLEQLGQRQDVTAGEVLDVDVVAYAGAVGGVVIVCRRR